MWLHVRWVLQADPEAGLDMFVQLRPPLAPATVLPVLRGVSPTLCAPYLEAALAAHVASRETYETELAVMYLQALLEGGSWPEGTSKADLGGVFTHEPRCAEASYLLAKTDGHASWAAYEQVWLVAGQNGEPKQAQRSPFAAPEKFPAKLDKGEAFKKLKTLVSPTGQFACSSTTTARLLSVGCASCCGVFLIGF